MKNYRIMNRRTSEWWEGEAASAVEACHKAGWLIGECFISEVASEIEKNLQTQARAWPQLYHAVKIEAAIQGVTIREAIYEALWAWLPAPQKEHLPSSPRGEQSEAGAHQEDPSGM